MAQLLLILIIVLIIFGAGKLPQLGEGLGKAIEVASLAQRVTKSRPEHRMRVNPVREKANQPGKLGVLILATIFVTSGCAGFLEQGRTGTLRYVLIDEQVLPGDLKANIGDEIRWVNLRPVPVRVTFRGKGIDDPSCNEGFTWFGIRQDSATIPPDGYASLCFSSPVAMVYEVTMEGKRPDDPAPAMATIRVVEPGSQGLAREGRS